MSTTTEAAPTLGEILTSARSQSGAFADWLMRNDPPLHARLGAALGPGETHIGHIRAAVGAFAHSAGHEDWVRLVSAVRDGDSPGLAALHVMLDWSLAQEQAG
ncbi:hypothetical protein ACUJ46_04120 [Sandaracinobacteroides sp. A072]|uniref:hypothetical protein n=1 Tax=Sandaracinobacteroides sp. A072 TaxID=3461146 RepID=UPI004041A624